MTEPNTTPAGITTRERVNVSLTSTGNFSCETTIEVTRFVPWESVEMLAVVSDDDAKDTVIDAYLANRLEQLGYEADQEIGRRRRRAAEAAS